MGLACSTATASSVAAKSFVSWTLAPATTTESGPPPASTETLLFTPFFALSVGLGPMRSPQNGPCLSPCPPPATPNWFRQAPRILQPRSARPDRGRPARPSAGKYDERRNRRGTLRAAGSIDSRFAAERLSRQRRHAGPPEGAQSCKVAHARQRNGSIFSHNSSGIYQIVGSGFL